ncbi:MAG: hypothetical protein L0Y76_01040, partial [Ignavibacteria bacterium]|nr:hypothetical protein [Ignavibacteria bacterium]
MKIRQLSFTAVVLTILVIFSFSELSAYPNGITGRTRKTSSQGCGSCHNFNSSITGSFSGPDSVLAGQTVTFTLAIYCASGSGGYGVDIAAKTGTLGII